MGAGYVGGFGNTKGEQHEHKGAQKTGALIDNLAQLVAIYPLSASGYFGTTVPHKSGIRRIASDNPVAAANNFYQLATAGIKSTALPNGKGKMAKTSDGYIITIREVSSSDGSPAIDIRIRKSDSKKIKSHKIHFVKAGELDE